MNSSKHESSNTVENSSKNNEEESDILEQGEIEGVPYTVTNKNPPKGWRYFEVYDYIVKNKIEQKPYKEAIKHILTAKYLPEFSRRGIKEITVYPDARILSLRCQETEIIFKKRWKIARETGWYANITGVRLTESVVSKYVDNFVKDKNLEDLRMTIAKKAPITLTPIATGSNRNAYNLKIGTYSLLLDAGMDSKAARNIGENNLVDAVIITHSHYDHMSGLFELYESGLNAPLLATATTLDYIAQKSKRADKSKLENVLKHAYAIPYNTKIEIDDNFFLEFYNAGHIPGSAMIYTKVEDFSLLYTGDFFLRSRLPVGGAKEVIDNLPKPLDVLIVDCTFIEKTFPAEDDIFFPLMSEILKVWYTFKGQVLISVDLGSTDIMMYLKLFSYFSRLGLKPPVYMDPQTINFMKILKTRINDQIGIIKEFDVEIIDPFSSVMRKELRRNIDILNAVTKPSIILSHPPTIDTPPITSYFKFVAPNEKNLLVITGPQRSGNGKLLLEGEKRVTVRYRPIGKREQMTEEVEVKAKIFNNMFPDKIIASHADKEQIIYTIDTLQPKHVIPFHAAPSQLSEFKQQLEEKNIKVSLMRTLRPITLKE
ncbi:MAG: MBL fold metallo-hydrolase [Candidatus Odinarchaeota archaeon]|nr:MBL fold metallo-hydrolase [Candidatus Odinarchaeota archaeon]